MFDSKLCFPRLTDHREQDDVFEPSHHLWSQPAPQAEELRQGVQRPELSQGRGEHGRHRRAAEDDRQQPNPLHGQSLSLCVCVFLTHLTYFLLSHSFAH